MSRRRVLVATDRVFPAAALESAVSLAGAEGEVVLASVVVVPHAQPLDASLGRAVADACAVLDAGERSATGVSVFDTRLLRSRSFSEGVLSVTDTEAFDVLVMQIGRVPRNGMRAQLETLLERADPTVVLVRPAG